MLKKISLSSFVFGFICCLIIILVTLGSLGWYYSTKGVTVTLGVSEVTPFVKEEVAEIIEAQIPFYVDGLKKEIPYIIDAEVTGQLKDASIRVGDVDYPLPEESIKGIEETFKAQMLVAMTQLLDGIDEEALAESISQDVANMVDDFIEEQVHNHTLSVNPISKIKVPVTIDVNNDETVNKKLFFGK